MTKSASLCEHRKFLRKYQFDKQYKVANSSKITITLQKNERPDNLEWLAWVFGSHSGATNARKQQTPNKLRANVFNDEMCVKYSIQISMEMVFHRSHWKNYLNRTSTELRAKKLFFFFRETAVRNVKTPFFVGMQKKRNTGVAGLPICKYMTRQIQQ